MIGSIVSTNCYSFAFHLDALHLIALVGAPLMTQPSLSARTAGLHKTANRRMHRSATHSIQITSSLGCANRSCGPPKPGRLLLSGVRRCRRRSAGSRRASGGPVGTPEGPVWVRTSIVHRYGTVERSVEPCRVPSCQIRVLTETRRNPIWPERTRRISTDESADPY